MKCIFLSWSVEKEVPNQILQNFSERLSQVTLPVEMLYTEGVISDETFDEVQRSNISPLRALSGIVSDNPNQLRTFSTILLQSEDTVQIGQEILKEYGKLFTFKIKVNSLLVFLDRWKLSSSTSTVNHIRYVVLV